MDVLKLRIAHIDINQITGKLAAKDELFRPANTPQHATTTNKTLRIYRVSEASSTSSSSSMMVLKLCPCTY